MKSLISTLLESFTFWSGGPSLSEIRSWLKVWHPVNRSAVNPSPGTRFTASKKKGDSLFFQVTSPEYASVIVTKGHKRRDDKAGNKGPRRRTRAVRRGARGSTTRSAWMIAALQ